MADTSLINGKLPSSWYELLANELDKEYFAELLSFVEQQRAECVVYPKPEHLFRAFETCAPQDVKVVIIGQDPYHGVNQANGLAFSVSGGVALPPSLRNILKEVVAEYGATQAWDGDLTRWAEQGVLLLNSVLTVRAAEAASHAGVGWERFTDGVVAQLAERYSNIVYILWGSYAHRKGAQIDEAKNCILKGVHPSPLAAYKGFFGCNHFLKANDYLQSVGKTPIEW